MEIPANTKLNDMMRKAGIPISIIDTLASNSNKSCDGKI